MSVLLSLHDSVTCSMTHPLYIHFMYKDRENMVKQLYELFLTIRPLNKNTCG